MLYMKLHVRIAYYRTLHYTFLETAFIVQLLGEREQAQPSELDIAREQYTCIYLCHLAYPNQ